MNRHRQAAQRNQLARIVIFVLGGALLVSVLLLTAWGAKAREVGRNWWAAAAAASTRAIPKTRVTAAPAAAIVVTKTADTDGTCQSGVDCSLREAIKLANAQGGDDTITFATGLIGTINLGGRLPDLTTSLKILGPGANLLTVRRATGGDYRIFTISNATVELSGLTISNGRDVGGAGILNDGTLTLNYCTVSGNVGVSDGIGTLGGGGICNRQTPLSGGGHSPGQLTINNSTISNNSYPGANIGGGLLNIAGGVLINSSTISGNSASRGGGIHSLANLTITSSTINNNTAEFVDDEGNAYGGDGGGICLGAGSKLFIANSTISGNTAYFDGGGLSLDTAFAWIVNCTITDNFAIEGGGITGIGYYFTSSGKFSDEKYIMNTIVAGNNADDGPDLWMVPYDGGGGNRINSQGSNLIGNTSGSSGWLLDDLQNIPAMIGPLANNGGPTATHALLAGSPAINGGNDCVLTHCSPFAPMTTDQRGLPRGVGPDVDIGAYEKQSAVTNTNDSGEGSLRQAILDANANPGSDEIDFAITACSAASPCIIQLASALPALSDQVKIIGPGANLLTVRRNTGGNYRIFTINSGATVTISGLTIANGKDGDCNGGGGVRNQGVLTIDQCVITGNVGCVQGGGIGNYGNLTISRSTISGNSMPFFSGGGIFNSASLKTSFFDGGTLTITNSTLSGNSSAVGGGLENADNGTATITNCTISGNNSFSGGGVRNFSGTVQAKNSIFAGNSNGDFVNTLTSQGYNLIQDASGATITGTTTGNQLGVNPLLGPLQNNGGPTLTHALLAGSPALDKGNSSGATTDQRGLPRPVDDPFYANTSDGSDIGAVEEQTHVNSLPTITDIANQTINTNSATAALVFTVGDVETAAGSLIVAGSSSNTTLVPNDKIVFGGSGASRTVTVTPATNQSGMATITITVTDANGGAAQDTFLLTVLNRNPTITDITNRTISVNTSTAALNFTVGDVETPAANLTVSGSSSNTTLVPNGNIVFGGSGASRTVTVTPSLYQFGTTTITITVTDANGGTAQDTFLLTVINTIVTNGNDSGAGSLRQVMADVPAGSTIIFDPSVTLVTLTSGQLTIDKNLTIAGPGANLLTVRRSSAAGTPNFRIFSIPNDSVAATLSRLTITGGMLGTEFGDQGGGIKSLGNLTMTDCHVTGNIARAGGGIYADTSGATLTMTDCLVMSNTADVAGGIFTGAQATMIGCQITGNIARLEGGIANSGGNLTILNSTVSNNTSNGVVGGRFSSGGIYNERGPLTITNSTISGNVSNNGDLAGGGLFQFNGDTTLTNVTITNNRAGGSNSAGGVMRTGGTILVRNSIIAANQNNAMTPDVHGSSIITGGAWFSSSGYNLIGNVGAATDFNQTGDQTGTGSAPLNPRLGPLVDNGGSTPTHALLPGSPALDKGNGFGVTTDQRGLPRPVEDPFYANTGNGSDIGAVEEQTHQNALPTITDIANQAIYVNSATAALAFTVGDLETPAANLIVSGSSSNTTLVPNGNIVLGGSGASRTVMVTPAANQSGTATITITATDTNGGAAQKMFLLTVNVKATISDIANQTINVNSATTALAFTVGDVETGAGSLSVAGISSNTTLVPNGNIVFGGSGASRTVTVTPAANQLGTATITITVTDANGGTAPDTFLLTVINTNPTITNITDQWVLENTATGAIAFTVGDTETPAGSLTVAGSSSNPTLVPNENIVLGGTGASRTVTITPAANQLGTTTITITVTDAIGGTVQDTFLLAVFTNIVANGNDSGARSLRQVIADAPTGTTITFNPAVTQITLVSGELSISKNLTINGPGAQLLTISGNYPSRVFSVFGGVTATLSGMTITKGFAEEDGGGVRTAGNLTILNCHITDNISGLWGGGLRSVAGSTLTITGSTISNNSSYASGSAGGGMSNDGGTVTITNSTISGNAAYGWNGNSGGGLHNYTGTVTITNSTITNNTALGTNSAGGIRCEGGTVTVRNSIIAANQNNSTTPDVAGDFATTGGGHNLIGNVGTATGFSQTGDQKGTDAAPLNPRLGALTNNGGPTQTHALLCDSPAVNSGDNTNAPATDQRGVTRPSGGIVDIGAFEAKLTLTINQSSLPNGTEGMAYDQTLTATGGATPYSFIVADGNLPTGLTLSTAGVLSGTPTTPGAFTFTVMATDANGAQGCCTYTVNIATANTAPTFTPADAISRQKGSPASSATVGTVADGQTSAGSLTVTQIAGGTATGITVTGITNMNGTITAQVSASCSATSGTVRFQVSDGSLTATGDLQVNVTNNATPTVTYAAVSVNAGNSTSNSPTTATDNGSITGYAVQSQGTYTGTINVNSSGVVSISNAAPVGSHTITIRATDNCGITTDATFTITVGNNLPTITAAAALSRQRGSAGTIETVAMVSDGETVAGNLVVTATTIPSGITITSITNANGTIKANIAASCTATVGANNIVLTVTDGNAGTATANLTVNVSDNTAPTLTYAAAAVNAGSSTTVNPATSPSDNGNVTSIAVQSQGTYTGTISVNSSGVVSISNAAPVGSHTIKIRATDNCGATTDASFILTVSNNLPTITPGAALTRQQGAAGTVSPIATVSDADTDAGNLVVTATTVPTGITIASISNSNGMITANVTAGCNATIGINTVVLTVTDSNGGTNTANLTVNVTANTAPTLTYGAASVKAGSATSNSPTTASDNGSITGYTVQSQGTYTGTISVNASGVVSISNAAPVGSHTITIRATDYCGATKDATFTLTVNNTSPTITAGAALMRQQGTAASNATIATVSDTEMAAGSLTVTAITVPAGITLTNILNTTGTITANVAATCAATAGDHNVVLQVSDGSLTNTAALTVTVSVPAANHLAFGTQPSGAQTGATISPAVTVQVLNQCNLLMTSATNNITLALGTNPAGGTLSGTLTKAAVGGVATFNNLSINKGGTGYTMTAANGGLTGATSNAFNITCPAITVSPTNLPNPVAGTFYSQTLTASGGAPNYSFSVPPGSLPSGLSLAANGTLSGTPTQTGSFTFTVTATDANGCTGTKSYTLQIDCFTITLSPSSLPAGTVGAAYPNNLSASGGVGVYNFRIISGAAPTGLTLNSNGTWSGTATAAGTFNFTVEAKDTNQCPGTKAYQVVIGCPSITLAPAALNAGIMGATYNQTLTPSGGSGSYTFNVTGLPSGLTANATTSNVTLGGTPTQAGSFTVNVAVTNNGCTSSQQLTLVISAPQPLPGDVRFSADFDGDGKADLVIWRPSTATFWVFTSAMGTTLTKQLGTATDVPVPRDYDGDGKTDFAVWQPATGIWMICQSTTGATVTGQWGGSTDVPVPGDYDGDGKTDLAIWRPSTGVWWIFKSSNGAMMSMQWGAAGDVPVPGDYDGNGQTDLAVWRASTFWIYSIATNTVTTKQWGVATDLPVPSDYDGDGKTDVAVWRPSTATWIICQSTNGATVTGQWGSGTDVPVPSDYDGDGKADLAIWRPSTGVWWIFKSTNMSTMTVQWGTLGDVPVS